MACNISYKDGKIIKVLDDSGNPSKLYKEAVDKFGEEKGLEMYLVSKSNSFLDFFAPKNRQIKDVSLTPNNILSYEGMFSKTTTGLPYYDDILTADKEDVGYHYFYKGMKGRVELMSPSEYLKRVREGFKSYKDWLKGYKQVEVPKTNITSSVDGIVVNSIDNQLPDVEPFIHLDVNNPQTINLNRNKTANKNIYKETIEEGNLKINKRGGTPENPKTITIKTKTGAIQATQNPDGSYMFHNAVDSRIDAGKAMLKLNEHLPKKPIIFETSSMSTDSYTNLLKIGKSKDWKATFDGFSPLNDSNKNVNFLDDLLKWKNRGANAAFSSEKTAKEAQSRMNAYLNKQGYNESANIVQKHGEWQMEVPNYRVQRNYQNGGQIPIAGASYLATQGQEEPKKFQQGGVYTDNEKKFIEELVRLKLI